MGQVLRADKIGQLSESSGTITLAPSILTIGGQQYSTDALNIAANLGSANTRYQIYAVLSAGSPILVVSSNENSVGPAGYNAWKLVGSYYTNGLGPVEFGSFVNIKGTPHTNNIFSAGLVPLSTTGGAFNKANVNGDETWLARAGKFAIYRFRFSMGAGSADAGNFLLDVPANMVVDSNWDHLLTGSSNIQDSQPGGHISSSGTGKTCTFEWDANQNKFFIRFDQPSGTNAISNTTNQPNTISWSMGGLVQIPIASWSNTAIEDL